ncbi:hypothetical protein MD484_g1024, partial [Candolleomyces efflorescens]
MVLKSQAELYVPSSALATYAFDIPKTSVASMHLVPGGRWLLVGCRDGSVWYYDLDMACFTDMDSPQSRQPRLLLKSPLATEQASKNRAMVLFAIDHTSELLNPSKDLYKVLEHFNLAVAVTLKPQAGQPASHWFQIWRVGAITAQRSSTELQALQRLSFFEDSDVTISDISIHGIHFAYALSCPSGTTMIVDWRLVNDKKVDTDDSDVWYLGTTIVSVSFIVKALFTEA